MAEMQHRQSDGAGRGTPRPCLIVRTRITPNLLGEENTPWEVTSEYRSNNNPARPGACAIDHVMNPSPLQIVAQPHALPQKQKFVLVKLACTTQSLEFNSFTLQTTPYACQWTSSLILQVCGECRYNFGELWWTEYPQFSSSCL